MSAAEVNYWYYPNLQYVGLPLGQSYYDSLVVDVVKRTGKGLTMDMSYDLVAPGGRLIFFPAGVQRLLHRR